MEILRLEIPRIKKSIVDYIVVSDNIILPNPSLNSTLDDNSQFLENSYYCTKSFCVYTDHDFIIGDHFLISCKIKLNCTLDNLDNPLVKQETVEIGEKLNIVCWNRKDYGNSTFWQPMQYQLEKSLMQWDVYAHSSRTSIDSYVQDLYFYINNALSKSLRINRRRNNKEILHWDAKIFKLSCAEKKAYVNYKNAPDTEKKNTEILWRSAKKTLKKAITKKEKQTLKHKIETLESMRSKDPRSYWKGLYDLDNPVRDNCKIPMLIKNSNGQIVTGNDACNAWIESFSKLGRESSDFSDFDASFYIHIKEKVKQFVNLSYHNECILDTPFTLEEVKSAISNLGKGKAVGLDGIMNEVFKYGGEMVAVYLLKFYQKIFDNETFPLEWARGLIVPLFKGGPEEFKMDPNKYRGITLLSIVGKTYTSILNKRIYNFIEQNNILADEQCGFRENRSTTDQIFILTEIIKNRRPRKTFCAFIDLAKTYDKVWREGLWYKIFKYGICGKMFKKYLC